MLQVNLRNKDHVSIDGLTQYDFGRVLEITGLDIEKNIIEVHFALQYDKEAIPVIGQVDEGNIYAVIPKELLEDGRNIEVYIYISSTDKGKTIRRITMNVEKRQKPIDYTEPEHEDMFRKTIEVVDRLVGEAKNIVKNTVDNMDESTKSEIADRVLTEVKQNEATTGYVVEMFLRHNMLNALITNKRILCSRNKILIIY